MSDEDKLWKELEEIIKNKQEKIKNDDEIKQNADAELLQIGIMNSVEWGINAQYKGGMFFLAGETCEREYERQVITLCVERLKNAYNKKYPQYKFEVTYQYFSGKIWSIQIKWQK